MHKFTSKQKEELLQLVDNRLDTINSDPSSADDFETPISLNRLAMNIKADKEFSEGEIKWMLEEATNREDDIHVLKDVIKKLTPAQPKILVRIEPKLQPQIVVWSEQGSKNGVQYSHGQQFKYSDGGRQAAGYKGHTGDCVCRAICIASGLPYQQVYDALAEGNATQKKTKRGSKKTGQHTASHGINVKRKWFQDYMKSIGFEWTPTMLIGQGCKVHLRADELPKGKLVISVSKHYTAMIDGVLMDTYDCSHQGTRCVYGYFKKKKERRLCKSCRGSGFGYAPNKCKSCSGSGIELV